MTHGHNHASTITRLSSCEEKKKNFISHPYELFHGTYETVLKTDQHAKGQDITNAAQVDCKISVTFGLVSHEENHERLAQCYHASFHTFIGSPCCQPGCHPALFTEFKVCVRLTWQIVSGHRSPASNLICLFQNMH